MATTIFVILFLVFCGWVGAKVQKHKESTARLMVKKYKTTGAMERDMTRLLAKGWKADHQTAAPGFLTGTRSYTVTYTR